MTLKKCPKCDGELRPHSLKDIDLGCVRCGRGWKEQPDGIWHSRGTATLEIVDAQGQYMYDAMQEWLESA